MSDIKYITVKVAGREEHLIKFVQLCKTMEYLGSVGSSRTIKTFFDGDGAARLSFNFGETNTENVPALEEEKEGDGFGIDFK